LINFLEDPLTKLLDPNFSWQQEQHSWGATVVTFHEKGILELRPEVETEKTVDTLALSCGVHGNETAPIEIVCDLLVEVYKKQLTPKLPVLIQFGNIEAMRVQERFVEFNLNRLFSGTHLTHKEALESARAKVLEESLCRFCEKANAKKKKIWHLDLHTAIRGSFHQKFAIRPFKKASEATEQEIELLKAMGIQAMIQSHAPNTTYSSFSSSFYDSCSFTMELGKVKPFQQNDRDDFRAAYEGLRSFIAEGYPPRDSRNSDFVIYAVQEELIREGQQTTLHLPDDYLNFKPLEEGQPIQTTGEKARLAKKGESVIFPNKKVEIGQRTGLIISPVHKP